jgi:hypothetical protein
MSAEPITIYSFRIDPRGVLSVLRSLAPSLQLIGPEDSWEKIVITGPIQSSKRASVLTLFHDEDFYNGGDWSNHLLGLQGYFSRFPDTNWKPGIIQKLGNLGFILSTNADPDIDIDSDDERARIILAVTKFLNGMIFSPSALRDAEGRKILAWKGKPDPDAVLPDYPISGVTEELPGKDAQEVRELEPPSPRRVAARALVLAAIGARGLFEKDESAKNLENDRKEILSWIEAIGIGDELEPDEWKVLQRPIGSLERQTMIDATWRTEGLSVLLWGLRCIQELPPYDKQVDPSDLFEAIGYWDEDAAKAILNSASMRLPEELLSMQTTFLALHWRLVEFSLRPNPLDFRRFAREGWMGSFDLTPFRIINNDLALGDWSISDAPKNLFESVQSCANERHLAINWLMGHSRIYSETRTDT